MLGAYIASWRRTATVLGHPFGYCLPAVFSHNCSISALAKCARLHLSCYFRCTGRSCLLRHSCTVTWSQCCKWLWLAAVCAAWERALHGCNACLTLLKWHTVCQLFDVLFICNLELGYKELRRLVAGKHVVHCQAIFFARGVAAVLVPAGAWHWSCVERGSRQMLDCS